MTNIELITNFVRIIAIYLSVSLSNSLYAELTIDVTKGVDNPVPIAIVPMQWNASGSPVTLIDKVVSADLLRSGQFDAIDSDLMLSYPTKAEQVYFRDWRKLGAEYVLVGQISPLENERFVIDFELIDIFNESRLLQQRIETKAADIRAAAHRVSDTVYETITGIKGAYSSDILYVHATGKGLQKNFKLVKADVDGFNPEVLFSSTQPIMSPSWSRDGRTIAYVSFENDRPEIFMQSLTTGKREKLSSFRGLNGAPAWSPDGKSLALVLSRDANPDIYIMDIATRKLRQVTRNFNIDTEPTWLDQQNLLFTSDRGGKPQIYKVNLANNWITRLTFEGDYNARPRVLPDGSGMVMVHRNAGRFHIAYQDLTSGEVQVLTETFLDESPSIAPNGSMLIYAAKEGSRGILAVVSIDGKIKIRLPSEQGDVREPIWSPYFQAPG